MRIRVDWHGEEAIRRARSALEQALDESAEYVLEEANRTVPLEEGTLMRSGAATREGLQATVSYDTPYARVQHERTWYRHAPGRRAKWLELTVREQVDAVRRFFARQLRQALKR